MLRITNPKTSEGIYLKKRHIWLVQVSTNGSKYKVEVQTKFGAKFHFTVSSKSELDGVLPMLTRGKIYIKHNNNKVKK